MNVTEVERKESTKHCCGNGCLRMDSAEHEEDAEALIDQRITENNNTNADRQANGLLEEIVSRENLNRAYRAVNFKKGDEGLLVCPNDRKLIFKESRPVRGNRYGRTEDIYECESCDGCPFKQECAPKAKGNRSIKMNRELTSIHEEVIENLNSVQGALLRMNRSIQAEGAYGIIKWDRSYSRAFRRGIESVNLEFKLISIGFNLYKYHNKRKRNEEISLVA